MPRFVQGVDRGQSTLLPECLEDWVVEDNPVRVIDAFVDALDLAELGFDVTASRANFLWCRRTDRPVKPIADALKAKNILVRYMNYDCYGDGLRISVGTDEEINRLLAELRQIV